MNNIFLNIGSGSHKLPGFVNIDIEPGADLQANVTQGLPFADNSVAAIFNEHVIEHLSQAEGAAFLRECRRVLVPGGVLRIATPDLDAIVEKFQNDWRDQPWLTAFGYEWINNRCEMLNISMREWEHKWLYNAEELARLAGYAGFADAKRCALGESQHPQLRGLEYRKDSRLVFEFTKTQPLEEDERPLVSVLIPAYKPQFMRACLESALNQTYPHLEIIVSDDDPTGEIERIVAGYADARIRYVRNRPSLGAYENYLQCFRLATGAYIKFLNDDDVLHPACIARMLPHLLQRPEVTLVTSHRQRIDAKGAPLPDDAATRRPVTQGSRITGESAANVLLTTGLNFIGEPSTTLFRALDLRDSRPHILSYAGRPVRWNVDTAMWLTLLGKGDLVYLTDTLSHFRLHDAQEQKRPDATQNDQAAWAQLRFDARRFGYLHPNSPGQLVAHPLQPLWPAEVVTFVQQADEGARLGDFDAARCALADALAIVPDDAQLLVAHGNVLLQLGDVEAARAQFLKAAALSPNFAPAHSGLAAAALHLGRADEAESALRKVLALNPADADVLKLLAHLALNSGRYFEGIQGYLEVLRHRPGDVDALIALGNCYFEGGQPRAARNMYLKALTADPGNAVAQENLAVVEAERSGPESAPVVDIVIPVYGQPQLVRQCVDSILRTTANAQIILVDDVSPDEGTPQLLAAYAQLPNVTVLRNPENLGFIGTTRRGAELGHAPFILFLNSDTECIEPSWLEKMIPADPDIAIVGARLLFPPDMPGPQAGTIQHAGVARNAEGYPYHPFMGWPAGAPEVATPREVNAVTGGCLLVRREVWEHLGGWDARFGRGVFEDVDLCWAARKAGWRILYQPAAVLYHRESASKELDGRHRLHAHSVENVNKLLAKWSPLTSDEHLFFGEETVNGWVRARRQIERAQQYVRERRFDSAFTAVRKALDAAPQLPEALTACAQLFAAKGDHRQSAEYFARAVNAAPLFWDARVRLVDELIQCGEHERAAAELAHLQAVYPHHPAVKQCEAKLAQAQPRPHKVETPVSRRAVETLQMLLAQPDLPAALEAHEDKLDADLLALVQLNSQTAQADGNGELAEGLDILAAYIENVIAVRSGMAVPVPVV